MKKLYFKKSFHGFFEHQDPQDFSITYEEFTMDKGDNLNLLPTDEVKKVKGGFLVIFGSFFDDSFLFIPRGVCEIRR